MLFTLKVATKLWIHSIGVPPPEFSKNLCCNSASHSQALSQLWLTIESALSALFCPANGSWIVSVVTNHSSRVRGLCNLFWSEQLLVVIWRDNQSVQWNYYCRVIIVYLISEWSYNSNFVIESVIMPIPIDCSMIETNEKQVVDRKAVIFHILSCHHSVLLLTCSMLLVTNVK